VDRDPITHAYFRELERPETISVPEVGEQSRRLLEAVETVAPSSVLALPAGPPADDDHEAPPLMKAMRVLSRTDTRVFEERMEELVYLSNVLVSGGETDGGRFERAEAVEAVVATVSLGLALYSTSEEGPASDAESLAQVLRTVHADRLFRRASRVLAGMQLPDCGDALVHRAQDLPQYIELAAAYERNDGAPSKGFP
jgi:hypothetical protein